MKRLGLVSDTHGRYDPALEALFDGVDAILHAGDICGEEVLEELGRIAPVRAVCGNNDTEPLSNLPGARVEVFDAARILVVHQLGTPKKPRTITQGLISLEAPNVIVFGHSHKALVELVDGRLYVNPGSAGPKRFSLPRSAAVLEVAKNKVKATVHALEGRGNKVLASGELALGGGKRAGTKASS